MTIYDIKIYDGGKERETIRGLSYSQKTVIASLLSRLNVRYGVIQYKK